MAAFMATDVKRVGELGENSIKTMLWLLNGTEPNDKKVEQEVSLVPWNAGTVSLLGWVHYLVCPTKVLSAGDNGFRRASR